jgi:hypothetical protein
MTAGRGIVHSEMPASDGVQKGLQLWINLASKDKMYVLLNDQSIIARQQLVFLNNDQSLN